MDNPLAQLVGLLATFLGVGALQLKTPRGLLLGQAASNTVFAIHYLMLGAYTASVGQILTILNSLMIIRKPADEQWQGWRWAFSALSLVASAAAWIDGFSVLPCLATVVIVLASWSFNTQIIRICRLCVVCPGWIIYDFHVGSLSGILCEAIAMISALSALVRFRNHRSQMENQSK